MNYSEAPPNTMSGPEMRMATARPAPRNAAYAPAFRAAILNVIYAATKTAQSSNLFFRNQAQRGALSEQVRSQEIYSMLDNIIKIPNLYELSYNTVLTEMITQIFPRGMTAFRMALAGGMLSCIVVKNIGDGFNPANQVQIVEELTSIRNMPGLGGNSFIGPSSTLGAISQNTYSTWATAKNAATKRLGSFFGRGGRTRRLNKRGRGRGRGKK